MSLIQRSIEQPITVTVGVLIALIAGLIAITRVPVQMTPEVDDTIIAVTTHWENASPQEIESEVIDKQEEKLQGLASLKSISSVSEKGSGQIRLEFMTGTNKENALREVSDKLREIPSYPANVDEPVIEASDPETNDFIAWFLLKTEDDFDIETLKDFTEDRVKPLLERTPGLSEVNVMGGRERETQIVFDPKMLAQHKISIFELTRVLRSSNQNISAGALQHGKYDLRVRTVGRFSSPEDITKLIIRQDDDGKVVLGDLAVVKETFKEQTGFVRNNGRTVLAINFQREPGSNVIEVMKALKANVKEINQPGDLLDVYGKEHNIKGLKLVQVYDQTEYIDQAFSLVQSSLLYGSLVAIVILMVFLRSFSAVGIIALSIPISVIGAIVGMVVLGRSVNVISLAGMSFAVGMVVDNAIVVLENIFRHAEMGKSRFKAALDGTKEVGGAVLASTLTTLLVFIPILLVEESAGQLLRDISLAIVISVGLSYFIAITAIPSGAALFLKTSSNNGKSRKYVFNSIAKYLALMVSWINGGSIRRFVFVFFFSGATFYGIYQSIPPIDYLPMGNRNLVFGVIMPPPGLNVEEFDHMAKKVEEKIRPYWEAYGNPEKAAKLPVVPSGFLPDSPQVQPAPVKHYFIVAFPGMLFHGGICADETKVVDQVSLFNSATSQFVLPGVFGFAFQAPLFRLGGNSGSAIKIEVTGADLKRVTSSALGIMGTLMQAYGPMSTRPDPGNFYTPTPELQIYPNHEQLSRFRMTTSDLGEVMQAYSDGIFLGDYIKDGELVDLKLLSSESVANKDISFFNHIQTATPTGQVVPLSSLGELSWLSAPEKIKRVNRQKAVTLEFTPAASVPLQGAIDMLKKNVNDLKKSGTISPGVSVDIAGSASKLNEVKVALLGDGTAKGLVTSAMFLALLVVYLLMCVLFQSWIYPLVIMYSVPLATFGGFYGLSLLSSWSNANRYMPIQNLDILTILGFIILAGVVVNNAILIVAQTLNMIQVNPKIKPKDAISLAVESRVRPIFMSMLTSVGGMLPLVINPGAGSELYRGLGAVVIGGLLVSTVFTLIFVPVLLGMVFDFKGKITVKAITQMGIVFLFIQGCTAVGPNYKSPEINLPDQWQQELPDEIKISGEIESQWWQKLEDPELDEIMELTLQNNFDIKIAQSRILQAKYLRGVANADLWPSIDVDGSYKKSLSSENINNDFSNGSFRTKSHDVYSIGLDTAWELDLFGGVRRKIEAEHAEFEKSSILLNGIVLAMLSESAEAYIEIRNLVYSEQLHCEMVSVYQQSLDLVLSKRESGLSTDFEVAQAKAQLSQALVDLPELQKKLQVAKNRLKILIGNSPLEKDEEKLVPLVKPFFLESIGLESPVMLLRRRPDILAAERQIAIESAKIGVVKADLYPKFFINGTLHLSASDVANVFKSGSENYSFGPSVQWNIFSRNKIKNKAKAQTEKMKEAEITFYKTVFTALAEVENAIIKYHAERKIYEKLELSREEFEKILYSAQIRYEEGLVSLDVVLDAQKEIAKQNKILANSGAQLSKSIVQLYKVLGGSWHVVHGHD